jgi:glutathione synthase/RimK-type ligase-like ATP-grasp enzyme
MRQQKIAFVCYETEKLSAYAAQEDGMLFDFLQSKGLHVQRVQWHDKNIRWQEFDTVILKSPWDYHNQYNAFMEWLAEVNRLGVQILNPYDVVRWNSDKHYLQQMIDEGFDVIPSVFLEPGKQHDFHSLFGYFKTDQLIVKPCISAGSKQTITVTQQNIDQHTAVIHDMTREESFMVQPFLPQIYEGELSYLFFHGTFSHCILKKPKAGDFRVQLGFGGTTHLQKPTDDAIKSAQVFTDRFAKDCLYARVDGVVINGRFTLMELELIEPMLYFPDAPYGLDKYHAALEELLLLRSV